MSYCGNCGRQVGEGQSFCGRCGAPVGETAVLAQQPTGASGDSTAAQQSSEAALLKPAVLNAQALPATTSSGKKILIAALAVLLVGAIAAIVGVVYVGYHVKQKATAALDKLESGQSADHKASSDEKANDPGDSSGDSNSRKDTDKRNLQGGKQNDSDDAKVAKGLDAIGGLMDKMGFGDPPPNPYQELPVVTADDLHRNVCDPNHDAKDLPTPRLQ